MALPCCLFLSLHGMALPCRLFLSPRGMASPCRLFLSPRGMALPCRLFPSPRYHAACSYRRLPPFPWNRLPPCLAQEELFYFHRRHDGKAEAGGVKQLGGGEGLQAEERAGGGQVEQREIEEEGDCH